MTTKTYVLNIMLYSSKSGESDKTAEYYGNFSYHAEGESSWTTLVETNESSPWLLLDSDADFSSLTPKSRSVVKYKYIDVPSTSTCIEIKASIKEYDPSIFDADEDLGTSIISLPLNGERQQKHNDQGSDAMGYVGWLVEVIPPGAPIGR